MCWESFIPDMPWTGVCRANFVTGRVRRVPERVFSRSLVRRGDISAPTGRPARPFSLNRHTVVMQTRAASHSHAQPHAARHSHTQPGTATYMTRASCVQIGTVSSSRHGPARPRTLPPTIRMQERPGPWPRALPATNKLQHLPEQPQGVRPDHERCQNHRRAKSHTETANHIRHPVDAQVQARHADEHDEHEGSGPQQVAEVTT